LKRLHKILLAILFTFILIIASGYYWLINGWKKYLTEDELIIYASGIKKEAPLPKEFKELYFKLYPKQKDASLTDELTERLIKGLSYRYGGQTERMCSCDDAAYNDFSHLIRSRKEIRGHDRFMTIKLGFALEKHLTNEECLNYYLRLEYSEFKDSRYGFSFEGKNFDDLNREDMIDFLIARKAPTIYSPWRNQENYIKAKKVIEKQLSSN